MTTLKPLYLKLGVDQYFRDMIDDNRDRDLAYCRRHGYEYEAVIMDYAEAIPHESWIRFDLILERLKTGKYSHVFWVDADTMIVDPSQDMRSTMGENGSYAFSIHPYGTPGPIPEVWHFQTGMMYWKSDSYAIEFLEDILSHKTAPEDLPNPTDWNDQVCLNTLLLDKPAYQSRLVTLRSRWNNTIHDQAYNRAIVLAWHGAANNPERRDWMRKYAQEHSYYDAEKQGFHEE